MKAIVFEKFGGPEVLCLQEVPAPVPDVGEILVRVHSVSVNRTFDLVVRQGNYPVKVALPHVLGVDPTGVVTELGPGVDKLKLGDRVAVTSFIACGNCKQCVKGEEANCLRSRHIGLHRWGGYAEYVAVPARNALKLPEHISFAAGSVITRHFPMAFNLLTKADFKTGDWVLVMGAAGALGNCCVQVAKMFGAIVIAGAGADERVELAKSLGADFGINYRTRNLADEVMRLTNGEGVDVVCENIGDPTLWPAAFNSLGIGGRLVTAGAHGGGAVSLDVRKLYLRRLRVIGVAGTNLADVHRALEAASAGKIRAIIDRIIPLRKAAEAHQTLEQNQTLGKIILDPTQIDVPK
jgi:NADPH2:quinone reductase